MNKRANLYLNIYSSISFLLMISCISLFLVSQEVSYPISKFLIDIFFVFGFISILFFVAIEIFLFILMKGKYKTIDILYVILTIISIVLTNHFIPFSAYLVYLLSIVVKSILRVNYVETIYIPKEFNRYCKMFGIKIKDFPKKRKTVAPEIKETLAISTEEKVTVSKKRERKSAKSCA